MWTEMVPFWLHVWAVGNGGWEGMLWRQRNKHVMAVWFQLYINVGIYYSVQKWWCGLLHPGMTLSSWQEVKIQEVTTRSHLFSHCNTKGGGGGGGGGVRGGGLKQNVASFRLPIFVCLCTHRNVDVHRLSFLWLRQWCWEPCACLDEKCYRELLVSTESYWSLPTTVNCFDLMGLLLVMTESYGLC